MGGVKRREIISRGVKIEPPICQDAGGGLPEETKRSGKGRTFLQNPEDIANKVRKVRACGGLKRIDAISQNRQENEIWGVVRRRKGREGEKKGGI